MTNLNGFGCSQQFASDNYFGICPEAWAAAMRIPALDTSPNTSGRFRICAWLPALRRMQCSATRRTKPLRLSVTVARSFTPSSVVPPSSCVRGIQSWSALTNCVVTFGSVQNNPQHRSKIDLMCFAAGEFANALEYWTSRDTTEYRGLPGTPLRVVAGP